MKQAEAFEILADVDAKPADLAKIAYEFADLRVRVAKHPKTYRGLLKWLQDFGDKKTAELAGVRLFQLDKQEAAAAAPEQTPVSNEAVAHQVTPSQPQQVQPAQQGIQPVAAQTVQVSVPVQQAVQPVQQVQGVVGAAQPAAQPVQQGTLPSLARLAQAPAGQVQQVQPQTQIIQQAQIQPGQIQQVGAQIHPQVQYVDQNGNPIQFAVQPQQIVGQNPQVIHQVNPQIPAQPHIQNQPQMDIHAHQVAGQQPVQQANPQTGEPLIARPHQSQWTMAQALDPGLDLNIMADMAQNAPELREYIARNRSAYPALLDWLRDFDDPAINRALQSRDDYHFVEKIPDPYGLLEN